MKAVTTVRLRNSSTPRATLRPGRTTHIIKYAGLSRKCHSVSTTPSALGFSVFTAFCLHGLTVLSLPYKIRGNIRGQENTRSRDVSREASFVWMHLTLDKLNCRQQWGTWYNGDKARGGVLTPGPWWLAGMRASKGKSVQMRQDPGPDSRGIHIGPLENHGKPKETRLGREMTTVLSRAVQKGSSRVAIGHLKCGWPTARCALSIKFTLDLEA